MLRASLEEKRGLETWRRVQEDVPGPVVFLHPGSVYQVPRACPAEDTAVSETGKTPARVEGEGPGTNSRPRVTRCIRRGMSRGEMTQSERTMESRGGLQF